MRDEMDGRIWTAHHHSFSRSVGTGLSDLSGKARRIPLVQARLLLVGIGSLGLAWLSTGTAFA